MLSRATARGKLKEAMPIIKVPLFAPEGYVTLTTVLDEVGKAVDAEWTGEELAAEPVTNRSEEDLDLTAFTIFMREGETRTEEEIRADVRRRYQEETTPRRRRQAIVQRCRELLHGGLPSIAFGSDGRSYKVPTHIWAADGAEEIFDTGVLLVQDGEVKFRRGQTQGDDTAIVLVKSADLKNVVKRLEAGESLTTLAPLEEPTGTSSPETEPDYQYRSGYPGRPSIKDLIQKEFTRRANGDECAGSLAEEARQLVAWVTQTHPDAPQKPKATTIENQIRDQYRQYRKLHPTK
jgi:hypothetical protein